jgi:hypothetical protein
MDGDTILDGRLLANDGRLFRETLANTHDNIGSLSLGHYNLWRSDIYYRVDSLYHGLNRIGRIALWRNNGKIHFPATPGLHKSQYPDGLGGIKTRIEFSLIHRGFATDSQIWGKYKLYKSLGQRGWKLDRLLDERTLEVKRIPDEVLPEWYDVRDIVDPRTKERIIEQKH